MSHLCIEYFDELGCIVGVARKFGGLELVGLELVVLLDAGHGKVVDAYASGHLTTASGGGEVCLCVWFHDPSGQTCAGDFCAALSTIFMTRSR